MAAFAFLSAQPDPERIGLYGVSMGGAAILRAMPHLPQARFAIVESTYADIHEVVGAGITRHTGLASFPFAQIIIWMLGNEAGADLSQLVIVESVQQIAPRPLLILHGAADPLIPVRQAQILYEAAGEPKVFHSFANGVHGGLHSVQAKDYERTVLDFIRQYL